jgi:predicted 2-oxoglutarate/Fe(II)-dependent dioxygenase YbiX
MRKEELHGSDVFTLHDLLSAGECEQYIARAEAAGFGDAPITTPGGFAMRKDIRSNDRVMIDDEPLAAQLFERIGPHLPPDPDGGLAVGLNERFRFYRYGPGQKFDWHFDGAYYRPNGEYSTITFMIYLNDAFTGGETKFLFRRQGVVRDDEASLAVRPVAGMALLFIHDVLHTGAVVTSGTKYVLRSDVMIRPAGGQ